MWEEARHGKAHDFRYRAGLAGEDHDSVCRGHPRLVGQEGGDGPGIVGTHQLEGEPIEVPSGRNGGEEVDDRRAAKNLDLFGRHAQDGILGQQRRQRLDSARLVVRLAALR